MTQKEIADFKIKCLEIAQQIAPHGDIENKAKEIFAWVTKP